MKFMYLISEINDSSMFYQNFCCLGVLINTSSGERGETIDILQVQIAQESKD